VGDPGIYVCAGLWRRVPSLFKKIEGKYQGNSLKESLAERVVKRRRVNRRVAMRNAAHTPPQ